MSEVVTAKRTVTKSELNTIVLRLIAAGDYRNAARLLWPWFEQNEWTDIIWDRMQKHRYLCIMGHGSASKTMTVSVYSVLDWIAHAQETALLITSDTVASMERRIWADFKTLWTKSRCDLPAYASIVDSKRMIRLGINDGKNAIHAIAAESDDAQSKIQGIHTKRIRVVIDEADNPHSQSIWSAISNLGTSGDLQCVALANPVDKNSEYGFHCEPEDGWDSVNPEVDTEWKSKLGWHVLRLDGLKSPNLTLGYDKYPYLLTNKGVNDIRDSKSTLSPEWWTYVRGWYPPDGVIKTIFSGGILKKTETPIVWYTDIIPVASCDPAFEGGDNCVVTLGHMGRMAANPERTALQVNEQVTIKRSDMTKTLAFDFADQIVAILRDRGVEPENFGIDVTGTQGPFADIIEEKLGKGIMRVQFGGAATGKRVSNDVTQTSQESYKNLVTELWYVAREWCRLGLVHIKVLRRDLRIQLEGRRYFMKGKDSKSGREVIQAEPKKEMKARGLLSPDDGDSFVILVHLVRSKALGFLPGTFRDATKASSLKAFQKNATVWTQDYKSED